MRLLSLRIDTKTGLIPTGGQSIGRSIFYLISLATVVGVLFALLSREGYTVHDRFTRTAMSTTSHKGVQKAQLTMNQCVVELRAVLPGRFFGKIFQLHRCRLPSISG